MGMKVSSKLLGLGIVALAVVSLTGCGSLSPFGAQNPDREETTFEHSKATPAKDAQITHQNVIDALVALEEGLDVNISINTEVSGYQEGTADSSSQCRMIQLRPTERAFRVETGAGYSAGEDCQATLNPAGIYVAESLYFHQYSEDEQDEYLEKWRMLPVSADAGEIDTTFDQLGGFSELRAAFEKAGKPTEIAANTAIYSMSKQEIQLGVLGLASGTYFSGGWESSDQVNVVVTLDEKGRLSEYSFELDLVEPNQPRTRFVTTRVLSYDTKPIAAPEESTPAEHDPGDDIDPMFWMGLAS